ncbi:MAG: hypothetical protein M3Q07_17625, partial [Pseudobdellovibrionaceae bacterium]|nr:hypothetical protein [Pseudobdellovibrionaceae bacterium]
NHSEVQPEDAEARALQERITSLQNKHDQNPELLRARLHLWLDEGELSKVATSLLLLTGAEHSPLGPETHLSLHSLQLSEFMRTFAPGSKERQDTLQELEQEQALKTHFDQRTLMHVRRLFQDYDVRDLLASRSESGIEAKRALLALAPGIKIRELVDALNPNETLLLAQSFYTSNRIPSMELQRWFEWAAAGSIPDTSPAKPGMNGASQECDASWILGFLISKLPEHDRRDMMDLPPKPWMRTLFYPELLRHMSESRARDILLSVDATNLLHWYASLDSQQQRLIWGILPEAYRSQIRASGSLRVDMGRVLATIKTYGREAAKVTEEGD